MQEAQPSRAGFCSGLNDGGDARRNNRKGYAPVPRHDGGDSIGGAVVEKEIYAHIAGGKILAGELDDVGTCCQDDIWVERGVCVSTVEESGRCDGACEQIQVVGFGIPEGIPMCRTYSRS